MSIREATTTDIAQIQLVRNLVKENTLSNPNLVTNEDCKLFLTERGKGWVYEIENKIVGFAIADLMAQNVWALFVHPDFDGRGIGRKLHDTMLDWYFGKTKKTIWLGTAAKTRAETFYRVAGWQETGMHSKNEIKFEMTYTQWMFRSNKKAEQ